MTVTLFTPVHCGLYAKVTACGGPLGASLVAPSLPEPPSSPLAGASPVLASPCGVPVEPLLSLEPEHAAPAAASANEAARATVQSTRAWSMRGRRAIGDPRATRHDSPRIAALSWHRARTTRRPLAARASSAGAGVAYPRTRIANVSFATLLSTLGTRLNRLIDGGRFSMTCTGIYLIFTPPRSA